MEQELHRKEITTTVREAAPSIAEQFSTWAAKHGIGPDETVRVTFEKVKTIKVSVVVRNTIYRHPTLIKEDATDGASGRKKR